MDEPVCKRCGKCCFYKKEDGKRQRCKYLITLPSGNCVCRVYPTRLGKVVGYVDGKAIVCMERKKHNFNYKGCPYNIEGQESGE